MPDVPLPGKNPPGRGVPQRKFPDPAGTSGTGDTEEIGIRLIFILKLNLTPKSGIFRLPSRNRSIWHSPARGTGGRVEPSSVDGQDGGRQERSSECIAERKRAEAGCHTDRFVGDVVGGIDVDELDPIGDAEFFSAWSRLLGERLAHADAGDPVIACPGAEHLARTAAEVEPPSPRFQTQRCAESGELLR